MVDIHPENFDLLRMLAREFNEWSPPERTATCVRAPSDAKGERPGDEYNRRADWSSVLEPHGWKVDHTSGDVTYWTRPGKTRFTSATTGKCSTEGRGDLLYVFSSNAHPFEADMAYSKFEAHALLNFGGDYSAAAGDLASKGYSKPDPVLIWSEPEVASAEADDVAGIDDLKNAGAEIKWVWPGWIQRGVVTAFAAQGGTGKTRATADLVRRVRHRLTWPDGTPMDHEIGPTVALWVVSDNHHDEMVTLCEAFGIADCVKLNAPKKDPYGGVTLDTAEEFAELERRVKATKPLFVVVDTVGNATDRNLSKQEDAKAFYQPLQLIARRQNTAVLALTHLNAGGKVLGRRALEKVRTCLRLNAEDTSQESKRRLEVIKSNSLKPAALGVLMGSSGNEYDDNPPPAPEDQSGSGADPVPKKPKASSAVETFAEALRTHIETHGAIRVSDALTKAKNMGFGNKVAYQAHDYLKLEQVEADGRKYWRSPVHPES